MLVNLDHFPNKICLNHSINPSRSVQKFLPGCKEKAIAKPQFTPKTNVTIIEKQKNKNEDVSPT